MFEKTPCFRPDDVRSDKVQQKLGSRVQQSIFSGGAILSNDYNSSSRFNGNQLEQRKTTHKICIKDLNELAGGHGQIGLNGRGKDRGLSEEA